jgi:hypothetical protein
MPPLKPITTFLLGKYQRICECQRLIGIQLLTIALIAYFGVGQASVFSPNKVARMVSSV